MVLGATPADGTVMTARDGDGEATPHVTRVWSHLGQVATSPAVPASIITHGQPRTLPLSSALVSLRQPDDASHNLGWLYHEHTVHLYGGRGPCSHLGSGPEAARCRMPLDPKTRRTMAVER